MSSLRVKTFRSCGQIQIARAFDLAQPHRSPVELPLSIVSL